MVIAIGFLHLKSGMAREGFPVTPSASWIIITIGIFICIYSAIRKIVPEEYSENVERLICPKCGEIYIASNIGEKCSSCNCDLEEIEGFFERHPDFISKRNNAT